MESGLELSTIILVTKKNIMSVKVCSGCGTELSDSNHLPENDKCHDCVRHTVENIAAVEPPPDVLPQNAPPATLPPPPLKVSERAAREAVFKIFERAKAVTREEIEQRAVSRTIPRLTLGLIIMVALIFLGSMLNVGNGWISSLLGCFFGLAIVGRLIFAKVNPLDARRWPRFWKGAVLGYWICYLPLIILLNSLQSSSVHYANWVFLVLGVGGYFFAFVIGYGVGLINILITDTRDKQLVLACFDELQARTAAEAQPQR